MKTAVVTGASRGIGRAVASRLLAEGYQVLGTSTSGKADWAHPHLEMLRVDMTQPESIKDALPRLAERPISVLVNNAGVVLDDRSDPAVSLPVLRKAFDINVFGLVEVSEACVPQLQRGGHVVNISSNWGTFSDHVFDAYCPQYKMSKAALNMYSKLLAKRLEERGVTVSAIDVGWVRTDLGGPDAPVLPESAADAVYQLIVGDTSTGHMWRDGAHRAW